jgi:hypothetical protein
MDEDEKPKNRKLLIRTVLGVVAVLFVIEASGYIRPLLQSAQLPTCDAPQTREAMAGAFQNSPLIKALGAELLSLADVTEVSSTNQPMERRCRANAYLSTGSDKLPVSYRLFVPDPQSGEWLVQFQIEE